jgi:hypothetical protein
MRDEQPGIARCPGCGRFYQAKYPIAMFDQSMIDLEDETCREAPYVHVHEPRDKDNEW